MDFLNDFRTIADAKRIGLAQLSKINLKAKADQWLKENIHKYSREEQQEAQEWMKGASNEKLVKLASEFIEALPDAHVIRMFVDLIEADIAEQAPRHVRLGRPAVPGNSSLREYQVVEMAKVRRVFNEGLLLDYPDNELFRQIRDELDQRLKYEITEGQKKISAAARAQQEPRYSISELTNRKTKLEAEIRALEQEEKRLWKNWEDIGQHFAQRWNLPKGLFHSLPNPFSNGSLLDQKKGELDELQQRLTHPKAHAQRMAEDNQAIIALKKQCEEEIGKHPEEEQTIRRRFRKAIDAIMEH